METIDLEIDDRVATVCLNRPPVNAVSRRMKSELRECFEGLSQDPEVNAVILAAAGRRAFCAGIDLDETVAEGLGGSTLHDVFDSHWEWRQTQYAIHQCPVPVIAAVERPAIGSGFGLIGVCDLVVAGDQATFGLAEINVGMLGGASKALRLLGPSKARRMMLLGELLPAAELYRLGAIEEVVPAGTAAARAGELAKQIASKSPIAMRLAKESILRIERDELMTQYRTENDYTNHLRTYADSAEALSAQLEKRQATWSWT